MAGIEKNLVMPALVAGIHGPTAKPARELSEDGALLADVGIPKPKNPSCPAKPGIHVLFLPKAKSKEDVDARKRA